ncbi:SMP-30/gluconolactonase/LRE family protein [Micromonospora sp. NPDC049799]|uniref:SMP-30/gluconolactonase/LRE family protein n=1 Tax=Micromonospora sp. NPDC049799 TaxID=3154741 RepID=UPI003406ED62
MRAEQISDPVAGHGEGPVWWPGWGGLRWTDMFAGDVLTLDPDDGTVTRQHVGGFLAAFRPRAGGGMVAALGRGFALVDADGTVRELGDLWADHTVRMNDGGCGPDGRFYCGSMSADGSPGAGSLYRLDLDLSTHRVLSGVTTSNGLAWSPDGTAAYYVDSATRRVDRFDHVDGLLVGRRPLAVMPEGAGVPDGISVDAEGHVWVAMWAGSQVRRYAPDGRLDARVDLPVSRVSACTFGGPALDQLFVTTSRRGVDPADEPNAGALFRVAVGVRGLPVVPFAG